MSHVDVKVLKDALVSEGFDVEDEKFVRALRKAENPGGCHWCGARTLIGRVVGKTTKSACCNKPIGGK